MELFGNQNGLTTFGIVLALATYTQAVNARFLEKIESLRERGDPNGDVPTLKNRLMYVALGDFLLVVLGLIAGWVVFIVQQATFSDPRNWWGPAFFIVLAGLSLMHLNSWKTAWRWFRNPTSVEVRLHIPKERGTITLQYPEPLLTPEDREKVLEWLNQCPMWTPPSVLKVAGEKVNLIMKLHSASITPEEQDRLKSWVNSFPLSEVQVRGAAPGAGGNVQSSQTGHT